VEINYGFSWTFRRVAEEGQARGAYLDSRVQTTMNRWKKIEEAKSTHP
jgi:hypothetical protein